MKSEFARVWQPQANCVTPGCMRTIFLSSSLAAWTGQCSRLPDVPDSSLARKKMAAVSFIASSHLPLCLLILFPVLFIFCHLETRMHLHPGLSVRQRASRSGAVPAFCQLLCVFDPPWHQHVARPKEKSRLLQNMVLKTEPAKEP